MYSTFSHCSQETFSTETKPNMYDMLTTEKSSLLIAMIKNKQALMNMYSDKSKLGYSHVHKS